MRRTFMVAAGIAAVMVMTGCKSSNAAVKDLTIEESVKAHFTGGTVFVDANNDDFRKENGKVPGAVLLANYRAYDAKQVLPKDPKTPLVFYCSNRL